MVKLDISMDARQSRTSGNIHAATNKMVHLAMFSITFQFTL